MILSDGDAFAFGIVPLWEGYADGYLSCFRTNQRNDFVINLWCYTESDYRLFVVTERSKRGRVPI